MQAAQHRWSTVDGLLPGATVREIAALLREGGVVAMPTETFYGLGALYRHRPALQRVLRLKERPTGMPLLLLVSGPAMARQLAPDAPEELERLAARFWPGPLTLVVPAPEGLAVEITSGGPTVAIRHPAHPVAEAIVRELGAPVTGTSANRSGRPPVRTATELELAPGVSLEGIVDAGTTPGGPPSTLLDITTRPARIVREGAVAAERLAEFVEIGLL